MKRGILGSLALVLGLPTIAQAKRDFELLRGEGSALRDGLLVMAATVSFWLSLFAIAAMAEG